jgi:hypothetical protein
MVKNARKPIVTSVTTLDRTPHSSTLLSRVSRFARSVRYAIGTAKVLTCWQVQIGHQLFSLRGMLGNTSFSSKSNTVSRAEPSMGTFLSVL